MGHGKWISRNTIAGTPTWVRDVTLNDSDKSFVVPANKRWRLLSVEAALVATATVGNRILGYDVSNSTPLLLHASVKTAAVTASNTGGLRSFVALNISTTAGGRIDSINGAVPTVGINDGLPELWLPAGSIIRVFDSAAIDAAADDLTVVLQYEEQDV